MRPLKTAVPLLLAGVALLSGNSFFATAADPRSATAPIEGLRDASPRAHALVGARIVTAPGKIIENGTLIIRDGLIESVGADLAPPPDARRWDLHGRTIYAGFIESQSSLFLPPTWKAPPPVRAEDDNPPAAPRTTPTAAVEPAAGSHAWNPRVTPERNAAHELRPETKGAEALRKLGFTLAHITPARGIFRGQSALVSLGEGSFNTRIAREAVAQIVAFEHGGAGERAYPTSLMGSIALARQTLLDAQWYASAQAAYARQTNGGIERPETNEALAAVGLAVRGEQPLIVELGDELDTLRAINLSREFKLKLVLRGSGYDYRLLQPSRPQASPVILSLDFPEAPDVENDAQALDISLDKLQHWELAPTNPARLVAAGTPIALTSAGLKKPETEFWMRLRKAVRAGLDETAALAALTTTPAEIFGVSAAYGVLAPGHVASLIVASGDLFKSDDAELEIIWIDGKPFELTPWRRVDIRGKWRTTWHGPKGPEEFQVTGSAPTKLKITAGSKDATARIEDDTLLLLAPGAWFGLEQGLARLTSRATSGSLEGVGELPDGTSFRWSAERIAPYDPKANAVDKEKASATLVTKELTFPAGAYGRVGIPSQPEWVLVKNAVVWTSAAAGNLENTDVLARRGKFEKIGRDLIAPEGAVVIDAAGKALTAGLIDAHSHTAISGGVNEGAHSVTCEARIGDVLDATDIGIYRELAGGLTVANVLHGSANAIGGQCQVIKLRWGALPDDLKFAGAKPDVKFALGENVTRKSSAPPSTRYPVTRMGVREIITDTFTRARDYERAWVEFRAGHASLPPRRDLQLDAALEILRGERAIHIHSYRQDEVLMFIRLAQEWKLNVAAFQHILEGYKVAPEIAKLGAGGSTFSDWWAYKYEVIDAIPYNGALMRDAGIVVSFNSDDDEQACRLNTEAAKAVKYGGVTPEEALKFVTINPAKQLSIDRWVGSIEVGKDADFVIWSGPPLSTLSRAEQTWIDGRCYFSLENDSKLRALAARERAALIQKILPERQKALGGRGGDSTPSTDAGPPRSLYHDGGAEETCSTEGGARR